MKALLVIAVLACAAGWWVDARAMLACYLAAWWSVMGVLMGGLANLWLHALTGGRWGEAIRAPLLRAGAFVPWLCLLFVPVLAGAGLLYPWAVDPHWSSALDAGDFKRAWLSMPWFIVRSVAYLVIWSVLALLATRAGAWRTRGRAAASLLIWMFTVSLAAIDWLASLVPLWHSSVYGWLAGCAQMLAGMALAALVVARQGKRELLPDLGNLLMMYVMTWAYLAYVQFLIIWAENLPHEIVWYVLRSSPGWLALAWTLVVLHLALPLLVLLSRPFKRSAGAMAALAAVLLAAHLLDGAWQVLPSLSVPARHWLWMLPASAAALVAGAWIVARRKEPVRA